MKHVSHRASMKALRAWLHSHKDGRRIVLALARLNDPKHPIPPHL